MKHIILEEFEEIDYTLIARVKEDDTVHEFVAAWHYDKESKSWGQGHYYNELDKAMAYLMDKVTEKIFDDYMESKANEDNTAELEQYTARNFY